MKPVIRGQRAGVGCAPLVGMLGLEYARGAGADDDTDAGGAVTAARLRHLLRKIVLAQRRLGEAIVTAVKLRERTRDRQLVQAGDFAGVGLEAHLLEGARCQPATAQGQGGVYRIDAVAETVNRGIGSKDQRRHMVVPWISLSISSGGACKGVRAAYGRRFDPSGLCAQKSKKLNQL